MQHSFEVNWKKFSNFPILQFANYKIKISSLIHSSQLISAPAVHQTKPLIILIIFIASIFLNKPNAVIIHIQFSYKHNHLLALSKGFFP